MKIAPPIGLKVPVISNEQRKIGRIPRFPIAKYNVSFTKTKLLHHKQVELFTDMSL